MQTVSNSPEQPHAKKLRDWQHEALKLYLKCVADNKKKCLLWEATPGAGKTTAALKVCKHQIKFAGAERIIVVVPTNHLKLQWARAAQKIGFDLDIDFKARQRKLVKDFQGMVLSYQQIGMNPKHFARFSPNAIVVLDEVHHSADGLTWGNALRAAIGNAKFLLCLSGTAFRSDNSKIPFIHYDENGISQPDYSYTYTQAIRDAVCRPTVFFTYGGEVAWSEGKEQTSVTFNDALDSKRSTKRLKAALDPDSGWIEPLIKDAHEMLVETRKVDSRAGGLLVASSQRHARSLAKVIQKVSGTKPVVVLSEDKTSSKKIKNFESSNDCWLVACNMVSEGVDIPRLRVGIYATTIRTKMYFRQFLGRIVRRTLFPTDKQTAFCYLPADPWLAHLAAEIEEEQRHCITVKNDDPFDWQEDRESNREPIESNWQALESTNSGVENIIVGTGQLSLFGGEDQYIDESLVQDPDSESLSRSEKKAKITDQIRMLVTGYHHRTGTPHAKINGILNRKQSVKSQGECTERQLHQRLKILKKLLMRR